MPPVNHVVILSKLSLLKKPCYNQRRNAISLLQKSVKCILRDSTGSHSGFCNTMNSTFLTMPQQGDDFMLIKFTLHKLFLYLFLAFRFVPNSLRSESSKTRKPGSRNRAKVHKRSLGYQTFPRHDASAKLCRQKCSAPPAHPVILLMSNTKPL